MSSGITVKIKLDPFYQNFLRVYFKIPEGAVFSFPKGHDLSTKLQYLLTKQPEKFTPVENSESSFEIELPYCREKDVRSYNYLSPNREKILVNNIILFYKVIFHEEINHLRNEKGFTKKDSIILFMEDYKMSEDYYDRIIRAYNRWVENLSRRRKRKKQKKSLT